MTTLRVTPLTHHMWVSHNISGLIRPAIICICNQIKHGNGWSNECCVHLCFINMCVWSPDVYLVFHMQHRKEDRRIHLIEFSGILVDLTWISNTDAILKKVQQQQVEWCAFKYISIELNIGVDIVSYWRLSSCGRWQEGGKSHVLKSTTRGQDSLYKSVWVTEIPSK